MDVPPAEADPSDELLRLGLTLGEALDPHSEDRHTRTGVGYDAGVDVTFMIAPATHTPRVGPASDCAGASNSMNQT